MNWAKLKDDFPIAYDDWMTTGQDIWEWVYTKGVVGYLYDPSVTGNGYLWEIKYMNREWNVVSTCDAVVTSKDHAFERMMWSIFWRIENKETITMEDYKKANQDFTPEDWKKAVKDVEGLMNLYTTEAVARHKRKKFWKTRKKS